MRTAVVSPGLPPRHSRILPINELESGAIGKFTLVN